MDELLAQRARSFGETAQDYADHRPDYPAAGIEWALSAADHPVREVLDLAAGTGKLTEGLLDLGVDVTAVEPDEGMLAELRRRHPGVPGHLGTAEAIPLADGSVDAVLVGQAFHWFDLDVALTEIARVLRPGGVVAGLWNTTDDRVDWVRELDELSHTDASRSNVQFGAAGLEHPAFLPFEEGIFDHAHRRTADSLTATIGTHSHTIVISDDERAAVLGRIRDYLGSRPETATGEFDLPIRTLVYRARCVHLAGPTA